jgi:hypothetical protein
VTCEASPAAGCTYPDLRHRHPKLLGLGVAGQHHVSHDGVKDGGVANNDHPRIAQILRVPDGVTPCVAGDVLGSIQDLAHVSGPSEPLVEEVVESNRIAVREGRCPRLCCIKDLLLVAHAYQRSRSFGLKAYQPSPGRGGCSDLHRSHARSRARPLTGGSCSLMDRCKDPS